MTGKTHQILGITAGLTYFMATTEPAYNPATVGAVLAFSYFGSLLPDIDQPSSKLWHMLPFGHAIGELSDPFFEHRNITHSILGVVFVGLGFNYLFELFPDYWAINTSVVLGATLIAYGSHLLADLLTNEGIPLFFPYKKFFGIPPKPLDGLRVATGKWFENLVIFPGMMIILLIIIWINYNDLGKYLFK